MFDVERYLARINCQGPLKPDLATLEALMKAHVYNVPFENLNFHFGIETTLDTDRLFKKIVVKRRGGFCYELNGLFSVLLQKLGYEVKLLSAQVARAEGGFGPEFDHLALCVKLKQNWLVDVGFGDSFLAPFLWDSAEPQKVGEELFRFVESKGRRVLMRKRQAQDWKPCYSVSPKQRQLCEFFEMCQFHASSKQSPFSKHKIVRMEKPDGRLSALDGNLKIISFTGADEDKLFKDGEYLQMLREYFGIEMDGYVS
jgi:N-hydroxyarylamine O-acetyltransferase